MVHAFLFRGSRASAGVQRLGSRNANPSSHDEHVVDTDRVKQKQGPRKKPSWFDLTDGRLTPGGLFVVLPAALVAGPGGGFVKNQLAPGIERHDLVLPI